MPGGIFLGNDFDNIIVGTAGDDAISAFGGDDIVEGAAGADIMSGGSGEDTLRYTGSGAGVTVSLLSGTGLFGDAAGDLFAGFEDIVGSGFGDTLTGDGGVNTLSGLSGNDTLNGLGGIDFLWGGGGIDVLDGGDGDDFLDGGAASDFVGGGAGDDFLWGGNGNDVVTGGAGGDTMDGGTGVDTLAYALSPGGVMINLAFGSASENDAALDTYMNFENLLGSGFNDVLTGDGGINIVSGGGGSDFLRGEGDNDQLYGQAGNDLLRGGLGADQLDGGAGVDVALYFNSASAVDIDLEMSEGSGGEAEGDTLAQIENVSGSHFDDTLTGDGQDNALQGIDGDDLISGQGGDDTTIGGGGADILIGGTGFDVADYRSSAGAVDVDLAAFAGAGGDAAGDTLLEIEGLTGSDFNDTLAGDGAGNALAGGDGADTLEGGAGADALSGGDGVDTAAYDGAGERVRVALDGSFAGEGDALGDTYAGVERVRGTSLGDVIRGDAGDNRLIGGGGNDTLQGRDGDDSMLGGIGADALTGGDGEDYFDYTSTAHGGDTIHDFATGADVLRFDDAAFGGLPLGGLAANRFATNLSGLATTGNHRFIYETDTGVLRYDSNGSGAGGVTLIATLTGAPVFTAADIFII